MSFTVAYKVPHFEVIGLYFNVEDSTHFFYFSLTSLKHTPGVKQPIIKLLPFSFILKTYLKFSSGSLSIVSQQEIPKETTHLAHITIIAFWNYFQKAMRIDFVFKNLHEDTKMWLPEVVFWALFSVCNQVINLF